MNEKDIENILALFTPPMPLKSPLQFIPGGRNNRAYYLQLSGKEYFVKHYNQKIDHYRSRLNAEYNFLDYAARKASQYVTKPIFYNEQFSLGVYEYLRGCSYQLGEVGRQEMVAALQFILELNHERFSGAAKYIHHASEACFSFAEHIECVNKRINRLKSVEVIDTIDAKVQKFISQVLWPSWELVKTNLTLEIKKHKLTETALLSNENRIISPSDFGFHNALKLTSGTIKFVDFEYAGWDDPAKLVGDFFNQIEVPVSMAYFKFFTEGISRIVADADGFLLRANLLLPLYRIKWIAIVLNYFLPADKNNKHFVNQVTPEIKANQLDKAKAILNSCK